MHLVSRYVKNTGDVADVTQEAFIKAYRALPNFRGDSAFYTWLYRIAVNSAKNYLVSQGRKPPASDVDADEADAPRPLRRDVPPARPAQVGADAADAAGPDHDVYTHVLQACVRRAAGDADVRAALLRRLALRDRHQQDAHEGLRLRLPGDGLGARAGQA